MNSIIKKISTDLYAGKEPLWWESKSNFTEQEIKSAIQNAYNYYNYVYDRKDLKPFIIEWMQKNAYSVDDIAAIESLKDHWINTPTAYLCRMENLGCDKLLFTHKDYIQKSIQSMFAQHIKDTKEVEKSEPRKMFVRDEVLSELKAMFDEYVDNFDYRISNTFDWFKENHVSSKHAESLIAYIEPKLNELIELQSGKDEQLIEGFKSFSKKQINALVALYDDFIKNAKLVAKLNVNKKIRKRKKKVRSVEKQIGKLKYAKVDDKYSLRSIDPSKILESRILWIFNSEKRMVGKYVAESGKMLAVKGTTILNFDEQLSISKKVRKPQDFISKGFLSTEKRMDKLFDGIKAKPKALNGRINKDVVLVKVF